MPVILASGGLDSTALFYAIAKNPFVYGVNPEERIINLVVDFGQVTTEKSIEYVEYHQGVLGRGFLVRHRADIPMKDEVKGGPIFRFGEKIEPGRSSIAKDYINGRNTFLITQGACLASIEEMDLFVGFHHEEEEPHSDRTSAFLDTYRELQEVGGFTKDEITEIRAPFLECGFQKHQVALLALSLGIDLEKTNSCNYDPKGCEVCLACLVRASAITSAQKVYKKWNQDKKAH